MSCVNLKSHWFIIHLLIPFVIQPTHTEHLIYTWCWEELVIWTLIRRNSCFAIQWESDKRQNKLEWNINQARIEQSILTKVCGGRLLRWKSILKSGHVGFQGNSKSKSIEIACLVCLGNEQNWAQSKKRTREKTRNSGVAAWG